MTAAHCLGRDHTALRGRNVLVAGGAGAVGHYAIEFAKHAGAQVVTTVSSAEKAELASAAGADHVIDYKREDVATRVRETVGTVDRVVEVALGANIELDVAVAAPGAIISVYAREPENPRIPANDLMAANAVISFELLYEFSEAELTSAIEWTTAALAAGALTPLPATEFALEDIVDAHLAVENGAIGKVIVRP
ncbi:zinc-binding dehydrogenase [Pseudonocardia oroxyli]|uniref:NADPH2:quinone reductase n=1 Tax=Pseudonocardia oroxyli TaxID=366584 RepID=A0A1G7ZI44_PSEOR|nr:zinc-binding dehydrogenase [Pseudonocardia oroxyli]SDH08247.1 NADPH2:quinone reductase [Pseudonocardia oroxyli]